MLDADIDKPYGGEEMTVGARHNFHSDVEEGVPAHLPVPSICGLLVEARNGAVAREEALGMLQRADGGDRDILLRVHEQVFDEGNPVHRVHTHEGAKKGVRLML